MGQTKVLSVKDLFLNPEKDNFQISPNGEMISFLAPWENRMNIHVQKGNEIKRITNQIDRDLTTYFWKGNQRILFLQDKKGDENFQLFAVNPDGSNLKNLTPFEQTTTRIVDELKESKTDVLIAINKRNPQIFDVYRLNTVTGEMKLVLENPGNLSNWITDHQGNIRVAISTDGVNSSFLYRKNESTPFTTIFSTTFRETVTPLFFTFDNQHLYALSNRNRDKTAIIKLDPATGKELEVLFQHDSVDVSGLRYSRKNKTLTAAVYVTDKQHLHFLNPDYKERYEKVRELLQNGDVEYVFASVTDDESAYIVRTYSDRSMGAYYLYYPEADGKLIKLADVNARLEEFELAPMQPIQFKSRDGLIIHGYLTLPVDVKPRNLPVVVNPHGGPWYRDTWGFNPEVQFLASRGYAVLQINFRGSTGYGRKFWEASFKQWGKKMQDDITDGVRWLISEGIADPTRIGIYGGSYGGYATLAGLTFTPELYSCGVDYVGVSNLFTFLSSIPPYWKPYQEMLYEMVGHPEKDK
ncbi:MAG: prolyl oligopeptidase family serine peptidase, partial [Bacteroidia bacterium]|nr:prolyl oligopeptidase family serine peptidase [Bacteroidia bacterium]